MRFLEFGSDPLENRRYLAKLFVVFSLLLLFTYTSLTILASLFIQSDNSFVRGVGAATYLFNVYMCHQMPERSFFLFGQQLSVCERDLAIFIGALLAYPAAFHRGRLPRFMQSWIFVVAALIPIAIDGTAQLFGLWESNPLLRFSTGFIAAFAVFYYLIATMLERFPPKGRLFRAGTVVPALVPLSLLLLALAAFSLFIGPTYKSESYFIEKARELSPGAAYYEAYYIAPHAFELSIGADQYISSYNDPVLSDIARMNTRKHSMGGWAVLALDEPAKKEGKYTYVSGGRGTYYYFDAWTGELISARMHSS